MFTSALRFALVVILLSTPLIGYGQTPTDTEATTTPGADRHGDSGDDAAAAGADRRVNGHAHLADIWR